MKIALHVNQKYGDVDQVFPFATRCLEYRAHILKHRVALSLEIEMGKVAPFIELCAGYGGAIVGVAGTNAR